MLTLLEGDPVGTFEGDTEGPFEGDVDGLAVVGQKQRESKR